MYRLVSPCLFGLEKTLAFEAKRAGGTELSVADGRVFFSGGAEVIARMNITSSVAERVGIVLGEFDAPDFDSLFEGALSSPIEQFAGRDGAFPVVKGHSVSSRLTSIPAIQRTVKKALAKRMGQKYGAETLPETGAEYPVHFLIQKDRALLTLDTTGTSLHKRGYREKSSVEAPIRETLAAGIVDLAHVRGSDTVCDPFCGSGTVLIEAAMKMLGIAPGMNRSFAAQQWECFDKGLWKDEFAAAGERVKNEDAALFGYDLDPAAVELTKRNAKKAGVDKFIRVEKRDIRDFVYPAEKCKIITNPPYAKRMLTEGQTDELYRIMGERMLPVGEHSLYVITGRESFQESFGAKADKERKLYNGMMKCRLYSYR
ncbi:MAG: class I SAM-dependent RNA methyltransferase [Oscillospiraceae bacterium]|nr:class I SAM-dependent RNA methyltransferase [Oscillospiraceae bacterium]